MGGIAQPFNPVLVRAMGRGELKTLRDIEAAGSAIALSGRALFSGLYVNELLIRTLPRYDPLPPLFAHYGALLEALPEGDERALRVFELALLDDLGYELVLSHDAEGDYIDPERVYRFEPGSGFVPKRYGQQQLSEQGHFLDIEGHIIYEIATWRHSSTELSRVGAGWLKQLTRVALSRHLGDKPLRSRELFRAFLGTENTQS